MRVRDLNYTRSSSLWNLGSRGVHSSTVEVPRALSRGSRLAKGSKKKVRSSSRPRTVRSGRRKGEKSDSRRSVCAGGCRSEQPFGARWRRAGKAGARSRVSTLNYKVKTVAGGDDINATIIPSESGEKQRGEERREEVYGEVGGCETRSIPRLASRSLATEPAATSSASPPKSSNRRPADDKCLKY